MSGDFIAGYGLFSAVLWSLVLWGTIQDVRRYHDDRAGFALIMAIVLVLISVVFVLTVRDAGDALLTFAVHVARGSVAVGALAIIIVRVQKRRKRRKR